MGLDGIDSDRVRAVALLVYGIFNQLSSPNIMLEIAIAQGEDTASTKQTE